MAWVFCILYVNALVFTAFPLIYAQSMLDVYRIDVMVRLVRPKRSKSYYFSALNLVAPKKFNFAHYNKEMLKYFE